MSVDSKDEVFLGETRYELAELSAKLKAVKPRSPTSAHIRGDKAINYGRMMEVMGVIIARGFRQLGLLGAAAGASPLRRGARHRPPRRAGRAGGSRSSITTPMTSITWP